MTTRDPKFAERAAEQFIRDEKITSLPIDPAAIAREILNIEVVAKQTESGVSGMLLRLGEAYAIVYASHINSEGFQRFSIAHEIGHYLLPGHIEQVLSSTGQVHKSHAGNFCGDPYETEADHFAAGLLMPDPMFSKAMRSAGDGIQAIRSLSGLCMTSLEATAIRFVARADTPTAIIRSHGQRIDYCFMSSGLEELGGLDWIRRGMALPSDCVTRAFNLNEQNVKDGKQSEGASPLASWFGGNWDIELIEEVQGLGSYGKTLTVLRTPDDFDPEEYQDEEELEDSYEIRFRR